jgi:hypothetical protein
LASRLYAQARDESNHIGLEVVIGAADQELR